MMDNENAPERERLFLSFVRVFQSLSFVSVLLVSLVDEDDEALSSGFDFVVLELLPDGERLSVA